MWFDSLWSWLEERIFSLPHGEQGGACLFNPYEKIDPAIDLPEASRFRRENLWQSLACLPAPPELLLIGEAPGWRGCRISGVPFASEAQIVAGELPFRGRRASKLPKPAREASATIFWGALAPFHPQFFAWNCLPLHPCLRGEPCSNRPPTRQELRRFLPELEAACALITPRLVLCVGRQAEWALGQVGVPAIPVRHPSHGGKLAFKSGVELAFSSLASSKV